MNTDTVIVTMSVIGRSDMIDIEIPDNRACFEVFDQAIRAIGWNEMHKCIIDSIEVLEPCSFHPRVIRHLTQTVLAADIRDGAQILVRLTLRDNTYDVHTNERNTAPTAEYHRSTNITFYKRPVLHGSSVTHDD